MTLQARENLNRILRRPSELLTLKRNQKRRGGSQHPNRDQQFQYIAERRAAFAAVGWPVISVDTKKKELIGNFSVAVALSVLEKEYPAVAVDAGGAQ